ncbi:MAG: hypothetical protein AB7K24_11035 [Gemmataceae bacterium]
MESTTTTDPSGLGSDLPARQARLQRDMLDQLERTAALENHWLMYSVWGWLNLAACLASHYLLAAEISQPPYHWALAGVWLAQIIVALVSAKLITGEPQIEDSPLQRYVRSLWIIFLLMACDVAILTLVLQQPIQLCLPFLATISSFVLLVASFLFTRRFVVAALLLFASGSLMASYPEVGFLIYGGAWLLVTQAIAFVYWNKRDRWREEVGRARGHHDTAVGLAKSQTLDG